MLISKNLIQENFPTRLLYPTFLYVENFRISDTTRNIRDLRLKNPKVSMFKILTHNILKHLDFLERKTRQQRHYI